MLLFFKNIDGEKVYDSIRRSRGTTKLLREFRMVRINESLFSKSTLSFILLDSRMNFIVIPF